MSVFVGAINIEKKESNNRNRKIGTAMPEPEFGSGVAYG